MAECERLATCGFFKKYQKSHASACAALIKAYCMDKESSETCVRKKIFQETGSPPDDDMMPTGQSVDDV